MEKPSILIAGAGPTGMAAALFLARRGVQARIVDRAEAPATTSKALAVNPRTLELLESSGVSRRIVEEGRAVSGVRFSNAWRPLAEVNVIDLHPRYRLTVLAQARTEALLAEALADLGIVAERGVALAGVGQGAEGLAVDLAGGGGRQTARPDVLYGADGAHSMVRHALGIEFQGSTFPEAWPLYDVELESSLDIDHAHVAFFPEGLIFMLALEPGLWRVIANFPAPLERMPVGARVGAIRWESSFHVAHRVAARAAEGCVALGGDAAHLHSPVGARGMNLGIEDGYAFATALFGAPGDIPARLEAYHRERHRAHRAVVHRIGLITRLARGRSPLEWLARGLMPSLAAGFGPARHMIGRTVTGLDHPLPHFPGRDQ